MTFATAFDALHGYLERLSKLQAVLGQDEMVSCTRQLQNFFNDTLWPLILTVDLAENSSQWRSATTELHRHMRLLAVESTFVQSARTAQTRQQRMTQLDHRLNQLQGFTQVLINLCK